VWSDLLLRALAGGIMVSVFALLGDSLKPKSFAGLFGAAPSVALASLALTYHSRGAQYVAIEGDWMVAGAVAFSAYAWLVCRLLRCGRSSVLAVASASLIGWFAVALGVWRVVGGAHQS
jgi:hypothetical protein